MKYTKENPLRVMTLASGYDSQCLALDRLKENFPDFDYELVAWAEFDPESNLPIERQPAVVAHNAFFPQWADRNYGDLTKIDWDKVPDFDLLTASTPCFEAGTLVMTSKGYKPIEEIQEGDMVLTHTNSFQRVATPMRKTYNGVMAKIYGMGTDIIHCTEEHRFYVRRMYKVGHEQKRCFHDPEWIKAKNLDTNCYLGYAINTKSELPKWNYEQNSVEESKKHVRLSDLFENIDFWYLMGRYLGDGWRRNGKFSKGMIICCSERNEKSLLAAMERCKLNYSIVRECTATKVFVYMKELHYFVGRYGYLARGKKIDIETMSLPVHLLQGFVNGYVDSDGCKVGKYIKTTSVSRELCFGLAQCVAKVYHRPFSIYRVARPSTTIIEGRTVNQKDSYNVTWKLSDDIQDQAFYEDGYIWYPLTKLPEFDVEEMSVYNMSVENDESYTANGAIVHNCQSISAAGLQHGFDKGSGTRSSIIWDVHDCVRVKRPKYIIMENVSAILSGKFLELLLLWCSEVEKMGYVNFMPPAFDTPWNGGRTKDGCLNAKNYGIPQNRERWFMVSILRTKDEPEPRYFFPKPFKLETCLADVLQEDVDESFFLRDEMLARFCEKSIENEKTDDGMELGIEGCSSDNLETCKYCKYECATEQCGRLYRLMEKFGKTPLGAKYPDF